MGKKRKSSNHEETLTTQKFKPFASFYQLISFLGAVGLIGIGYDYYKENKNEWKQLDSDVFTLIYAMNELDSNPKITAPVFEATREEKFKYLRSVQQSNHSDSWNKHGGLIPVFTDSNSESKARVIYIGHQRIEKKLHPDSFARLELQGRWMLANRYSPGKQILISSEIFTFEQDNSNFCVGCTSNILSMTSLAKKSPVKRISGILINRKEAKLFASSYPIYNSAKLPNSSREELDTVKEIDNYFFVPSFETIEQMEKVGAISINSSESYEHIK